MKIYYLLLTFFFLQISLSQDILTKNNGEHVEAKIELISSSEIKYKMFKNLNGPSYVIGTSELKQIKLQNGEIQTFDSVHPNLNHEISKEETMEFIVKSINGHGFEEDSFKRRYRAKFEGDYLRLIIL